MKYDYLIVGAGLFGATFAQQATAKGKCCFVIERRPHIAGNCYTESFNGIQVHKYGAHIFHTSNETIWKYINQFSEFNNYINQPIAVYKNKIYNLPFNMNTFNQMWGVKDPAEAINIIERQRGENGIHEPKNLEEQALFMVGRDIYEKLIKGYTEKQWGRQCKELPVSIIKRLPLRFTFNNNYFNDRFQGIPIGGYTEMILNMLKGIEVKTNTDYFTFIAKNPNIAEKIIYTGAIDEFFNYKLGALEYRSLQFKTEVLKIDNYQGNAVVNYTDRDIPHTRVIEHKHFEFGQQKETIITYEYPACWDRGLEPYYPINDKKNIALYKQYQILAKTYPNVIFGGRLGEYKYYDMDKVIERALIITKQELFN